MTDLSTHLASLPAEALHTVLHIGAGDGLDLDAYRALNPKRLILVEGDPDTAQLLADAARDLPGAEVHPVALASAAGPLSWNRYNLRFLNGPLDASGLARIFPRLRCLGSTRLDAQAISGFIEGLALAPLDAGEALLVLDVPGQEQALLDALQPRLARRFDAVLIRSARPGLLPGADPSDTDRLLRALHYRSAPADDADDLLWTTRLWRFDPQAAERAGHAARIAALENDLATARAARLEQAAQANAAAEKALSEAKTQFDKSLAEAKAQIEALTKSRDEQAALARDRAAQLEQVAQAKAAADKAAQSAKTHLEAASRSRDDLSKELEKARHQANEARDGMVLALRLQTLRENDLVELQKRYSEVYNTQRTQHELLTKLAERLTVANEYFQLVADHEEPVPIANESDKAVPPKQVNRTKAASSSKGSGKSSKQTGQTSKAKRTVVKQQPSGKSSRAPR